MERSKQVGATAHQEAAEAPADLIYDGLRVQLRPTSLLLRTLALAVDYGLISLAIVGVIAAALLALFGGTLSLGSFIEAENAWDSTAGVLLLVVVLLVFFVGLMGLTHGYFIYYEYKKNGQTPGKKLFGLRVVTIDGSPLSLGKCLIRETMRYVDVMFVLPGLLSILLTKKHQRLGDLLAGTMVSYSRHEAQENAYLYVKQSDYLYLHEVLSPQPVPETTMREFLTFAYQEFIRAKHQERHQPYWESWEQVARQYVPHAAAKELDQLTILLFFAEYCHQTINHIQHKDRA
jgi:uncharacterized RDD family membrane protein YckC